jgi:type II secretory pathway pseudopilin PulG
MKRSGFTIIELLVSVAIMILLAGLILSGLNVAMKRAKVLQARRDIDQLQTAWSSYLADYGRPPLTVSITNSAVDCAKVLGGHLVVENRHRYNYMDFHVNSQGIRDPWDNYYMIVFDENGDGNLTVRRGNQPVETLRRGVVVWSMGPDGMPGTKNDVTGWRTE